MYTVPVQTRNKINNDHKGSKLLALGFSVFKYKASIILFRWELKFLNKLVQNSTTENVKLNNVTVVIFVLGDCGVMWI